MWKKFSFNFNFDSTYNSILNFHKKISFEKKISLILIILSLLIIFSGYFQWSNNKKKNSAYNLLREKYLQASYEYVAENGNIEKFMQGNSKVKLLNNSELDSKENSKGSTQEKIKLLEESLTLYKERLKEKDDINIKKNYEIVKKELEEEKKKEQSKDNQDKNNNSDNKDKNKDNNDSNDNKDKDKDKDKDNKDNNQKENQKNQDNKDEQNNESSNPKDGTDKKSEEIRYILKKLEGNEEQAFKNNERLNKNNDSQSDSNQW